MEEKSMLLNIIMLVAMYPVIFVMYFLFRVQYKYTNGCLFAVNMKPEWIREQKVEAIVEKFKKEIKSYFIFLLFVPLVSFLIRYSSIQITIWTMWVILAIMLMCLPLIHANHALKAWKKEQCLYKEAEAERYVELKSVGKIRKVKFTTFLIPNIAGLAGAIIPIVIEKLHPEFAKIVETESVCWICILMWLCGLLIWVCAVWMDRQPVTVICYDSDTNINYTRARKNIWKNFWLITNWTNTAFIAMILVSAIYLENMGYGVLIFAVIYTLITVMLCFPLMHQLGKVEAVYEKKRNLYDSEEDDRHWIGGIFYYNPADHRTIVTKKIGIGTTTNLATPVGKGAAIFSVIIMVITIPAVCVWVIMLEFTPIRLIVENQTLYAKQLNTDYKIDITDIRDLEKITELPSWSKSNGSAMDTLEKGTFFIRNVGKCEVFLNPENTEFLHFSADGTEYYMSGTDDAQTREIYESLNSFQMK